MFAFIFANRVDAAVQKPQKLIIGDPYAPETLKTGVILTAVYFGLALAVFILSKIWPETFDFALLWFLLAFGAMFLAKEAIGYLFFGKRQGQTGSLILDERGVGGMQVDAAAIDERIAWSRIKNVESDSSAVILKFEPIDLTSENPSDRISQVRLSYDSKTPEEIEQAILNFWRASKD